MQVLREFPDFRPIITKPDTGRLCIRITPSLDHQFLHSRPTSVTAVVSLAASSAIPLNS